MQLTQLKKSSFETFESNTISKTFFENSKLLLLAHETIIGKINKTQLVRNIFFSKNITNRTTLSCCTENHVIMTN